MRLESHITVDMRYRLVDLTGRLYWKLIGHNDSHVTEQIRSISIIETLLKIGVHIESTLVSETVFN